MLLLHRNVVVFQFAFEKDTKFNYLMSVYTDKYSSKMSYVAIYGKKRQKTQKKQVFSICGRGQVTKIPKF